ncbi:uncharacterized protein Ecym_2778 [Eremothecium cymbalariae DBVPG|uniref:Cytosolic endo-beta-N-acetylglucosaminidase TIM barrel domain-containing protein n=1 Tax=Eremothecium cymbalariae (strain CBS 270.75 / DBVPG 7215 / KCTC 17166 / NRRL Y-17582) TaxID=931890 RepID=G8JQ14_ERECY|nr:Hypothetical protein Ecym_2778 [Eremothecium cymbalariae DBVPG\
MTNDYGALYFDSLVDLELWFNEYNLKKSLSIKDQANVSREPLNNYIKTRSSSTRTSQFRGETSRPIVTVCHDMKGGYNPMEDSLVFGDYRHPTGHHYWLRWPELVDEFIYFSHHFVTIPPVGWLNYLHRFGIPVLGTLILEELDDGYSDSRIFQRDKDGDFTLVKILTNLCQLFQFEGWLLNFETRFLGGSSGVVDFVRSLQNSLKLNVKDGRLIWYDSYITKCNKALYQNEVNDYNWEFFNVSDRFFTNYSWDVENVKNTVSNVGKISMRNKIIWGIDVWGRNMKVGSGGLTSEIPAKIVSSFSSNIGLFAPAWTYENFQYDDFLNMDDEFWGKISSSAMKPASNPAESNSVPWYVGADSVSFLTVFSHGAGTFFNFNGKSISLKNWVQLSMATPMPKKSKFIRINDLDAFFGGSCVSINIPKFQTETVPIFDFNQCFKAGVVDNYRLKVRVCYKGVSRGILPFLTIKCSIVRRAKKSSQGIKVKDLTVRAPLYSAHSWEYAEAAIDIPKLSVSFNEELHIESCELAWCMETFEVTELGEEPWLIVPDDDEKSHCGADAAAIAHRKSDVTLGLFSIEIAKFDDITYQNKMKAYFTSENGILSWPNSEDAFMWIILEGGHFKGVSFVNFWPITFSEDIQLFKIQRNGKIMEMSQ